MTFRFKNDDEVGAKRLPDETPARRFGIRELVDSPADRIMIKNVRLDGIRLLIGLAAWAVVMTAMTASAKADHPVPTIDIAKADIVQRLKAQGYTEILMIPSTSSKGEWIGSVYKNGERISVTVNAEGQIIHR